MKKIFFFFILSIALFTSCSPSEEDKQSYSFYYDFYKGPFEIRKMVNDKGSSGKIYGGFFLFTGAISGSGSTYPVCNFSWKTKHGFYVTSSINLKSIKIILDENLKKPQLFIRPIRIIFPSGVDPSYPRFKRVLMNPKEINYYIDYIIIKCNPNQWKVDINLPLEDKGM